MDIGRHLIERLLGSNRETDAIFEARLKSMLVPQRRRHMHHLFRSRRAHPAA